MVGGESKRGEGERDPEREKARGGKIAKTGQGREGDSEKERWRGRER